MVAVTFSLAVLLVSLAFHVTPEVMRYNFVVMWLALIWYEVRAMRRGRGL